LFSDFSAPDEIRLNMGNHLEQPNGRDVSILLDITLADAGGHDGCSLPEAGKPWSWPARLLIMQSRGYLPR
jgi:hypothetical protein